MSMSEALESFASSMNQPFSAEVGVRVVAENPVAVQAAAVLGDYLSFNEGRERRSPLPHQQVILSDIWNGLNDGYQRGYVESPTASGKTYLMCRLADAFYAAGMRVLLLADRRQQADQILGKVGDTGLLQIADSIDFKDIGVHYEGVHATPEDKVVVSTYGSFNKFAPNNAIGHFDVMISDEAHRTLGPVTSANLINYCPDAIKIGFTATPAYSLDKKVDEIFDHPYHNTSIKEAVEADIIAPLTCLIYTTNAEIPYLDSAAEFSQEELSSLISLKGRNQKAVEFAKSFIKDGRQGIIGCVPGSNLLHAKALAQELDGDIIKLEDGKLKFIRAKAVGGFLSPSERREILTQFENGQIDVLTFVDMITEGWNSDVASFLIDLQPTASLVKKTQKIGRVLRKKPGNLQSIVVDFMDITRKGQITALDALKERRFVLGHTFRRATSEFPKDEEQRIATNRNYIERMLGSDLWYELRQIDMQRIADLRLHNASRAMLSTVDPLVAKYEQLLGKNNGQELFNSMDIPTTAISALSAFMKRYVREQRVLPQAEDVRTFIEQKLPTQGDNAHILAQLAIQGFDADPSGLLQADPRVAADYDLVEDDVVFNERMEAVDRSLAALPPRERRILEMRYGIGPDGYHSPMTLEQIGHQPDINLTGTRVNQLEGQALSRLSGLSELARVAKGRNPRGERFRSREEEALQQRLDWIEKQFYLSKLHVFLLIARQDKGLPEESDNPNMPTMDQVKQHYNLYLFIKALYSKDPSYVFTVESRNPTMYNDYPHLLEEKIDRWSPMKFTEAKPADTAVFYLKMKEVMERQQFQKFERQLDFDNWLRATMTAAKRELS